MDKKQHNITEKKCIYSTLHYRVVRKLLILLGESDYLPAKPYGPRLYIILARIL